MPERLPAILAFGAIALLASSAPSHAEVTPAQRPPAVPPLSQAHQSPAQIATPISVSQAPLPDTPSAKADKRATQANGNTPRASEAQPPKTDSLAPIIAQADNREASTQDASEIALASFLHPIKIPLSFDVKIALDIAPAETTASDAPLPAPDDLAKSLPDIKLEDVSQEPKLSYQASLAPLPALKLTTEEANAPEAATLNLPDIKLTSASQDIKFSSRANIASLPAPNLATDETAAPEVATLHLADIQPRLEQTLAFQFDAPIEPYAGEITVENKQKAAKAEVASIRPRPRPEGLVASIDEKPADPEKIEPKAEPVFQLRR